MEDAHLSEVSLDGPGSGLFGVFDGHGGREVAQFVAKHIKETLTQLEEYKQGQMERALERCYVRLDDLMRQEEHRRELADLKASDDEDSGGVSMNQQIIRMVREQLAAQMGEEDGERDITLSMDPAALGRAGDDDADAAMEDDASGDATSAGCTAVCALVHKGVLYVANAGDSRAVLCRNGVAVAMSHDHKPNDEVELARITKAGGMVVDGRVNGSLNLSRALGDLEYKQSGELPPEEQMVTAFPEIMRQPLQPGDEFIILACDGIWDVLENQQAVDFVRERLRVGKAPRVICEELCDHCLAPDTKGTGKGCDNMTAMVVQLKKIN